MNKKIVVEFSVNELRILAKFLKQGTSRYFWNKNPFGPGDTIHLNEGYDNEITIKIVERKINIV